MSDFAKIYYIIKIRNKNMIHFQSELPRILCSSSIIFLESLSSIIAVSLLRFVIFENIVRMSPPLLEDEDDNIFDRLNNEEV